MHCELDKQPEDYHHKWYSTFLLSDYIQDSESHNMYMWDKYYAVHVQLAQRRKGLYIYQLQGRPVCVKF